MANEREYGILITWLQSVVKSFAWLVRKGAAITIRWSTRGLFAKGSL
jgi:hypothetical protein